MSTQDRATRRTTWTVIGDTQSWVYLGLVTVAALLTFVPVPGIRVIALFGAAIVITLTATLRAERKRRLSLGIIGIGMFAFLANLAALGSGTP